MSRPAGLKAQLEARLRELGESGLDGLPPSAALEEVEALRGGKARARRAPARTEAAPPAPKPAPPVAEPVPAAAPVEPPAAASEKAPELTAPEAEDWRGLGLEELAGFLKDCRRCRLCEGRTQVVFGVGDPRARLMFVGEGPGRDEDLQGEPFVGRAGRLLTDMIQKGMRLKREEVYIANVVKCRPPENRDPKPEEVEACEGFLKRQVELVKPEVIVALGRFAVQCLLRTQRPIGKLRGNWHEYEGIPLMPTFHPAYLLRNEGEKRAAWEDLKLVMAKLGLQVP